MTENDIIRQAMANLDSIDDDLRAKAIETLGEQGYAPAVPKILEIAQDTDPGTLFIAVKALGRIGDAAAVPLLLNTLRGDDPWVRASATGALISIGTPAVDGLSEALRDEDKAVRRAAAKALGKIGTAGEDDVATRRLSAALLDVDKAVRKFAAEALGRIGADHMVPELSETLHDKNPEVRIAAFRALAAINTQEASQTIRKWVKE